jgi:hypothetical protein
MTSDDLELGTILHYYLTVTATTVGVGYRTTFRFTEKVMRKEARKGFKGSYQYYTFDEYEMVKTVAD